MEYLRWILLVLGIAVLAAVYFLSRRRNSDPAAFDDGDFDSDEILFERKSGSLKNTPAEVDISEEDARSHVLSNMSHELETLNKLLGRKAKENPQPKEPEPQSGAEPALSLDGFEDASLPQEPILGNLFEEDEGEAVSNTAQEEKAEKIITFHICARNDEQLPGSELLRVFKERGYEFGEMDIFHSRVDGYTVFSIVNMVEPGWFDPESMNGFTTPGISLFLQLPGPLAGETALDLLLREARELGRALDAVVLDGSRSTLTLQTEQHLREELKQYDFQKKRDIPH